MVESLAWYQDIRLGENQQKLHSAALSKMQWNTQRTKRSFSDETSPANLKRSPSASPAGNDEAYDSEDGHTDDELGPLSSHAKSLPIFNREHGGYCGKTPNGDNNNEIYYFGIIDILQQYNMKKMAENFYGEFYLPGRQKNKLNAASRICRTICEVHRRCDGLEVF